MNEIFETARLLGRSIEQSPVNLAYSVALDKLKANPELSAKVREFKRVQADYGSGDLTIEQEKHLSKLYFDLCMNSDAKEFLNCEKKLLRLMLEVQEHCSVNLELFE